MQYFTHTGYENKATEQAEIFLEIWKKKDSVTWNSGYFQMKTEVLGPVVQNLMMSLVNVSLKL